MNNIPKVVIKLDETEYPLEKLEKNFLEKGTERWVFIDPRDSTRVIKISLRPLCKQTRKESHYFSFIKKRHIPFTHLPEYYGSFEGENYMGICQRLIRNEDGSRPEIFLDFYHQEPRQAEDLLVELFAFLYRYNILPADLTPSCNILVVKTEKGGRRCVLVDGLYCKPFIPLNQYIKFFGRRSLKRQFYKQLASLPLDHRALWKRIKKQAFLD